MKLKSGRRKYGLDFFPTIFEVVDYEEMSMLAAFGGFPLRVSALAVRHRVRGVDEGLRLRPAENLRDGDQQRPVLRLPAGSQRISSTRSWSSPTSTATAISSRTTPGSPTRTARCSTRWPTTRPASTATATALGAETVEVFIDACLSLEDLIDVALAVHQARPDAARRTTSPTPKTTKRSQSTCGSRPRVTWTRSSIRPRSSSGRGRERQQKQQQKEDNRCSPPSQCAT